MCFDLSFKTEISDRRKDFLYGGFLAIDTFVRLADKSFSKEEMRGWSESLNMCVILFWAPHYTCWIQGVIRATAHVSGLSLERHTIIICCWIQSVIRATEHVSGLSLERHTVYAAELRAWSEPLNMWVGFLWSVTLYMLLNSERDQSHWTCEWAFFAGWAAISDHGQ